MNSPLRKIIAPISLFFIFFLLLSQSPAAHAQAIGNASLDGVDISSVPPNPAPGADVTVSIESYSINLDTDYITWTVNNQTTAQGNGIKSIQVTAPAVGKSTQVLVSVKTPDGADIRKVITIKSGDVDLIWETSGYTPPLYRGKDQLVYQNSVKFTAIPHFVDSNGKAIDPRNLIYTWSNGSTVLGDQSGYGKQSLIMQGAIIPQTLIISVQVTSSDQSVNGTAAVTLDAIAPSIVFYQDDPLYGVEYNTAIGSILRLSHDEVKVVAAPFGFDINDNHLSYSWDINNVAQDSTDATRSIILRVNAGEQGSSDVGLTISNDGNNILQGATAAFTAIFNSMKQATNSTLF